ncbi:hypothetical protein LY625_08240 [Lysobacter sp. GX 14042]|uniref:hypothetical protein n=1 Tax=Lysobacter sp. GX 14042 TaxID=2907155 RepID=UPI001F27FA4A|nr:hypothetical protein [Lysobacter sp. GX 14042]MCE7032601.1 hypothetical protein [Lysobacter sp. GX 14042]
MTTINQQADAILDVGDRFLWRDDYDARLDAFAEAIEGLDPQARAELFDAILEKDGGATMSWLTPDRLNDLVDSGRITGLERDAITDAFAQAYVDGEVDLGDALQFTGMLGSSSFGPLGLMPGDAEGTQALMDMLVGSDSPAAQQFIEKFAADMLGQRLLVDPPMMTPAEQGAMAGILLNALEQSGGTQAIHNVLGGLSAGQRDSLYAAVGQEGQSFGSPMLDGVGLTDPMELVIQAVADHGTAADALHMVEYVGQHSSGNIIENQFYGSGNKPIPGRADALADLFIAHGDTLMRDLTVLDPSQTPGSSNENSTVMGENLAALSNLIRLTALNPDSSRGGQVMDMLGEFVSDNIRQSNQPESDGNVREVNDATTRVAMLGAVMQDAVDAGYIDLRADIAARDEMVGFMLDIAISAIPVAGDLAAKPVADAVADMLGDRALAGPISDKLGELAGGRVTDAQGRLTAEAKQAIIDALPEDHAFLEEVKTMSNDFITSHIVETADRRGTIIPDMQSYSQMIDGAQGEK